MSKTTTTILSAIFLLLPATQSISLANTVNEKTYDFSISNLASGNFQGTDTNNNGLLETSEISNFSLSVNSNSNHQCQTKDLQKFVYESPSFKLNRQAKELENELYKYIEKEEGIFIRTKEKEIRYALIETIAYAFEDRSDRANIHLENQKIVFQDRLTEKKVSASLIKDATVENILNKISRLYFEELIMQRHRNRSANIYIHCASDDSKFKTDFVLDNFKEEGVFGIGGYSLETKVKQGFLNSSSRSISGMVSPHSISIKERKLEPTVSKESDRAIDETTLEERSTNNPISHSANDLL